MPYPQIAFSRPLPHAIIPNLIVLTYLKLLYRFIVTKNLLMPELLLQNETHADIEQTQKVADD